ncbi:MAG TPA: hypothetical protein VH701_24105 [Vicinamibacterales bacterium]|jgi:hypothetical protein
MNQPIERAVADASAWADIPGVSLVGQGATSEGNPCIIVKVSTEEVARKIPSTFQGFPVIVEPTDEILAQRRPGTRTPRG